MLTEADAPLLELVAIRKSFPGVVAVKRASLEVRAGEIHALVGENGAGKSTLVRVISGAERADSGEVRLRGRRVTFASPLEARRAGIAAIHQELALVPGLSVRANLFLGMEPSRRGVVSARREREAARAIFGRLGVVMDAEARVDELDVAHRQLVEIARALAVESRLIVMDEPTAALTPREVDRLFDLLRELAAKGIGILFISHRLDEVLALAGRVTVMRDGETLSTGAAAAITRRGLVEAMVGRAVEEEYPRRPAAGADGGADGRPIALEVRGLSGGKVRDVSFAVREGEVLGIAGLMGAGRTEMLRLLFGADRRERGEIRLGGRTLRILSPRDAIAAGISLLTEDRKAEGLVLGATARENFALPNLGAWSRLGWINQGRERLRFEAQVRALDLRMAHLDQTARELSGGNQQKLLVARWLETDARVFLFDEPTRGVDVGARYEIYQLMNRLAAGGRALVVVSSDLPEILGIADRILVMRGGRVAGEIADARRAAPEDVMAMAV